MDLTRTAFEFVKKLRDHPKPNVVSNPVKGLPYRPLIWLSEQLGIESLTMYVFPTPGRAAIKKRVYGTGQWRDLSLEQAAARLGRFRKTLIPVTSRPREPQKNPSLIGYIGVARHEPLTEAEEAVLRDAADFVGEYMYDVFAAHRRQQCQRAHSRVKELRRVHRRPGTLVRHVQGVVHRSLRAHMSYYCILDDKGLAVEYYQRNEWNRPKFPLRPLPQPVNATFRRLCYRESYFQWIDLNGTDSLAGNLRAYGGFEDGDWEYLTGVVANDGVPIAVLIFQFSRESIIFYELYRELVLRAANALGPASRYLYQRRTLKLIVDPIFRSRDTRVDPDLAFVLMPYTEDWSRRIWENFVRPIIAQEGLRPERADELHGTDIMEDVWQGIIRARVIVADTTNRNPNVFYELGIAHTVGKDMILLTQDVRDIPFDLNRYRHIVYEDNHDGYRVLSERLTAALREISRSR